MAVFCHIKRDVYNTVEPLIKDAQEMNNLLRKDTVLGPFTSKKEITSLYGSVLYLEVPLYIKLCTWQLCRDFLT